MSELFAGLMAILITAPIIAWALFYWILKLILKDERRALHWSVDITTVFVILSVEVIMNVIWHHSFFGWVFFAFLLAALLFTAIYWWLRESIDPKKLMKGIWRFNFLIFMIADIILFTYGLIAGIVKAI